MSLFSKLKDYNRELEEILDQKTFSSNIKSLLFSMIYKIETSYPDFKLVKRCVRSKEDFLNEIIETIRLYCDNVKTVEPDSSQAKMLIEHKVRALTNEKERSILVYPTELDLLYAISEISPKYFYVEQDFLLKNKLQTVLVNGYNYNNLEILKNFTGWSWDQTYDENFQYLDNLIYQNFLCIFGEKFLYEWRNYGSTRRDFLLEAKNYVKNFTGNEKYIKSIYNLLYLTSPNKASIDKELKESAKFLVKMQKKEEFIEDYKKRKILLTKKIEKFNFVLNDKKILEKELMKYNSKREPIRQIRSLKKYQGIIELERNKNLKELEEIEYLLKPSNFIAARQKLKEYYNIYTFKGNLDSELIESQKEFLIFLYKKLNQTISKEEIKDIIFELRYYKKLKISKDKAIEDIEEIDESIDKVLKLAIKNLTKLGAIKIISNNEELNFEIIKYALDTKIINLDEIRIALEEDSGGLMIKVYDKDIFEKQGRKKINLARNLLEIKQNRKVKLFN